MAAIRRAANRLNNELKANAPQLSDALSAPLPEETPDHRDYATGVTRPYPSDYPGEPCNEACDERGAR